jgi:hypothetical protein
MQATKQRGTVRRESGVPIQQVTQVDLQDYVVYDMGHDLTTVHSC